jgi:hypothetical protein
MVERITGKKLRDRVKYFNKLLAQEKKKYGLKYGSAYGKHYIYLVDRAEKHGSLIKTLISGDARQVDYYLDGFFSGEFDSDNWDERVERLREFKKRQDDKKVKEVI